MSSLVPTSVRKGDVLGNQRVTTTDCVLPSSYVTGGVAVTAAQLGLVHVQDATAQVVTGGANGPVSACALAQTDGSVKIKCNKAGTNPAVTEVAATTDLSAATVRVRAWGY